jgi:predicted nucleic acid-binding protein
MPFEPGLIDANVLVYAMDADAPQHAVSRALLESARTTSAALYVTLQTLVRILFCGNERPARFKASHSC